MAQRVHLLILTLLFAFADSAKRTYPGVPLRAVVCQRRLNHQHVIGFREVSLLGATPPPAG